MIERNHAEDEGGHPLAIGLLVGSAIGVGMGMLLAPRSGSEMRHQVAEGTKHLANSSHDAYCACRDAVKNGAGATRRYVHEISDTIRRKNGHSDVERAAGEVAAAATGGEFGASRRRNTPSVANGRS